jgi:hypothetical protein
MSIDTPTETSTPEPDAPTSPDPEAGTEPESTDSETPNKEAAKYRRRLREAEAERDKLAGVVTTMQTREVERIAGTVLANGADLLEVGGVALADLLDQDGRPDVEKIEGAARSILTERPYLAGTRGPRPDPSQGAKPAAPSALGWSDVLRP